LSSFEQQQVGIDRRIVCPSTIACCAAQSELQLRNENFKFEISDWKVMEKSFGFRFEALRDWSACGAALQRQRGSEMPFVRTRWDQA
jgi:hypothetical protein